MNKEVVEPLPSCLQSLLEKQVLVSAKRDELSKLRGLIEKDRKILNRIRPRRDRMRDLFEAACKGDPTVKRTAVPKMGLERFCEELYTKKVIGDVKTKPTPQVAGEEVPEFHCVLTAADAKQCFVTVQVGDVDGETITFDEFMVSGIVGHACAQGTLTFAACG